MVVSAREDVKSVEFEGDWLYAGGSSGGGGGVSPPTT
jgi:hypothetical protein